MPLRNAYAYRLTPASLERGRSQGLHVKHLLTLLRRSALVIPPILIKRWKSGRPTVWKPDLNGR